MASREILSLDTATPQIVAPQTGDTYSAPRAVAISPESLTGSAATTSLDIAQTWNTTGTPTAIKLNVTDTASNASSLLMDLQVGGSTKISITKAGIIQGTGGYQIILGGGAQSWLANLNVVGIVGFGPAFTSDTILTRDAANTLAQRNATNAQTFRVYNTFTDASNYERLTIQGVGASGYKIIGESAGTGVSRSLQLDVTAGSGGILFATGGVSRFAIASSNGGGHFIASTDNTYDIGASGANRPRTIYVGTDVRAGVNIEAGTSGAIYFNNRTSFSSSADGVLRVSNQAGTDFGRLQFGGTTSSFPALKRNSTTLETKLADDSAYAAHAMQYLDVTDGMTAPASATGRARIYVDTADGDLKVIFGDGTVKTIVTDT